MFKVIKSKLKPKLEDAIEDIVLYTVSQKTTHYNIVHNFAKCLPIFNFFFTDRFTRKYATKSSLTIPPHLKGVAELPCETSVSENSENLMHASLSTTNHKVL